MKTDSKVAVMAHMIPFFPDENTSRDVVEALVESGITWLEIQFPFTDPTADGPVIEAACMTALGQGFTVDKGFAFVKSISDLCARAGVQIYIMTYASLVWARGVERFVADSADAGAAGLIVPDLPPDRDEGLYGFAKTRGMEAIPVIIPTISPARQKMVTDMGCTHVYAALRTGITGSDTVLEPALLAWLESLRTAGVKVLGGFGIKDPAQAALLSRNVEGVVVGSAIVNRIRTAVETSSPADRSSAVFRAVKEFTASLVHPA